MQDTQHPEKRHFAMIISRYWPSWWQGKVCSRAESSKKGPSTEAPIMKKQPCNL